VNCAVQCKQNSGTPDGRMSRQKFGCTKIIPINYHFVKLWDAAKAVTHEDHQKIDVDLIFYPCSFE
jgi:hypothetical protein